MGRSLDCIVLPFSEAGARSIKLRHFSPLKEKDYFRRQKLIGFPQPPLSDWCLCHQSHLRPDRTCGLSHPACRPSPVPPARTKITMVTRLGSPLGLRSFGQESEIQLVKKIAFSNVWVPVGSVGALSQGWQWLLHSRWSSNGRARAYFTNAFALLLLIVRAMPVPHQGLTAPPGARKHCHGHRCLNR